MSFKEEIDKMLDVFEGKTEVVEEKEIVEEKEEVKEEIKEEIKEEKEELEKKEEVKEEIKEEKKEEIIDDKDKVIEDLRRQLNERPIIKEEKEEKVEKKEEVKEEPLKFEDHDFIGDADPEDIIRDKSAFNKLLNAVYSKGVTDAKKMSTESVLLSIPDIVKSNVAIVTTLKEASEKFYKENEDLQPFKKIVAIKFEELAAQNPDKKYDEILKSTETEVRKILNLQKNVQKQQEKKKDGPPTLPEKKGGPREKASKPDLSSMERELEEMNKVINS